MNSRRQSIFLRLFLVGCLFPVGLAAQTPAPTPVPTSSDLKAEAIVTRALEVVGGNSYLNVQTVVGRGFFTAFKDGTSLIPAKSVPNLRATAFALFRQTRARPAGYSMARQRV